MDTVSIILICLVGVLLLCVVIFGIVILNKFNRIPKDISKSVDGGTKVVGNSIGHLFDRVDKIDSNENQRNAILKAELVESVNRLSEAQEVRLENIRNTLSESLNKLNQSNDQKLTEIRRTVDEKLTEHLETTLSKSFETVSRQLESVHKSLGEMQNLANGVGDLKKVLSNTKTRGILGEYQLSGILKEILSPQQYEENIATVPGSSERVEFAVKLPSSENGNIWLPIDAKFPAETYIHLQEAQESGDKNRVDAAKKELITRLRNEAKDISTKYVHVPDTTEFGIMFLPTEGLYAEACNLGMMEALQRDYRITIAGPSTMAALLNSLQMGFKTLAIQKRSNEVWTILGKTKTEFEKFEGALTTVQKNLKTTTDNLDDLVGTRTRAINRALRGIENDNQIVSRETNLLE